MTSITRFAASLLTIAIWAVAVPASAQNDGCSHDVFMIDGASVAVGICSVGPPPALGAGQSASVRLVESVAGKGTTFKREVILNFLGAGKGRLARSIDDVDLGQLGILKSLHLTIGYRDATVTLEHALLVPGAQSLK